MSEKLQYEVVWQSIGDYRNTYWVAAYSEDDARRMVEEYMATRGRALNCGHVLRVTLHHGVPIVAEAG